MGEVLQLAAEPGAIDLRERARAIIVGDELTQATAAREIGISAPSLNQWLAHRYPNPERLEAKIEKWIRVRQERAGLLARVPQAPIGVRTSTAIKIGHALRYAQGFGKIVAIYGAAGAGKTEGARLYRTEHSSCWIATITPSIANLQPALDEIGQVLEVGDGSGVGARKLAHRIRAKLKGSAGLLIIDEAQYLSLPALEEIRAIHDATGCGIALMGGITLLARLTGGTRSASMAQLFSRIAVRLYLEKPAAKDVAELLAAWKIGGDEERKFLAELAAKPGALRVMTRVIEQASAFAAEVSIDELRDSWSQLGAEE